MTTKKGCFVFAAVVSVIFLFGCGGKKAAATEEEAPVFAEVIEGSVVTGVGDAFVEPASYNADFGMHARSDGNDLILSFANRRSDRVRVIFKDLAIIYGNQKSDILFINAQTADVRNFVPLVLDPGQRSVTRLRVTGLQSLQGLRAVYNNPRQGILTFADIE